jgi:hypothetical protein
VFVIRELFAGFSAFQTTFHATFTTNYRERTAARTDAGCHLAAFSAIRTVPGCLGVVFLSFFEQTQAMGVA